MATLLCHYRYDPLDRLTNQTRPDTPTHQRFYSKSRLATEIQGAMQYSLFQHEDLLLAQQQREGDSISANLLATDLKRSVVYTLEKNQQRQFITFSPHGYHHGESGLTSLLLFNGERSDPVTGHYLLGNGYRAFNTVLMRFNSPDSLSPFGKGGLNSYGYCLGDPINLEDPTGHIASLSTWHVVRHFIKFRRLQRLEDARSHIMSRILSIQSKYLEPLYFDNQKLLADPLKPQKLQTLAFKEFQKLPEQIKTTSPQIFKKIDHLENGILRDKQNNLLGHDLTKIEPEMRSYKNSPEIISLRKHASKISIEIFKIGQIIDGYDFNSIRHLN